MERWDTIRLMFSEDPSNPCWKLTSGDFRVEAENSWVAAVTTTQVKDDAED